MNRNPNIIVADKPVSLTSKDFADQIKKINNFKKICFCGRLDPMARGQMLFLANEMCKEMDYNQNYDKTYQFEIFLGIKTDSDDPLGVFEDINFNNIEENKNKLISEINLLCKNYPIIINQEFHKFSSIRVNGQPMWLHSKNDKKVTKPKHIVNIKKLEILDTLKIKKKEFIDNIVNIISKINKKHDFRQNNIIESWKKFDNNFQIEFLNSIKIELKVSSGFYVRQFVRDLSEKIEFPLMVFDINRINIDLNN